MYMPHTVTLYNVEHTTDASTFEDTTTSYVTVLTGVFLTASKGVSVAKDGTTGADAVTLHIPFDVSAVDGTSGDEKTYCSPAEFEAAADKSLLWTLSTDKGSFFVKGEAVSTGSFEEVSEEFSGVYVITRVDECDYGTEAMQHWEVGGR